MVAPEENMPALVIKSLLPLKKQYLGNGEKGEVHRAVNSAYKKEVGRKDGSRIALMKMLQYCSTVLVSLEGLEFLDL
ncbi:MAG: hypothetical protein CM15mP87_03080 [Candidatus Neomarinimicrobiota bacterium]|nr:MAG: hypothetical protein CM15mP87_03080 [Candidatus Neomarinimicrobiota bacterium]